jgi:hypothetical protein
MDCQPILSSRMGFFVASLIDQPIIRDPLVLDRLMFSRRSWTVFHHR